MTGPRARHPSEAGVAAGSSGPPPLWAVLAQGSDLAGLLTFGEAEIEMTHQLVAQQFRGGLGQHHTAGLEDIASISDRERHLRALLDKEHGGAARVDLGDDVADTLDHQRC